MQFEFVNDSNLLSVSGDSKLILWDLKALKPKQILEIKSFLKEEAQVDFNGIDRFDYDPETGRVLVHIFKANFLIQFDLDNNGLSFSRQIVFNDTIDDFVRLSTNVYLFANLNDELNSKFLIKKFTGNSLGELDQNDLKFNSLSNKLNSQIILEKGKYKAFILIDNLLNFALLTHNLSNFSIKLNNPHST